MHGDVRHLALVSQSLAIARRLERPMVDAGLVASELSLTNKFVEGTQSGDLGELLGNDYRGYTWTYNVEEERTNKLFNVDIAVKRSDADQAVVSTDARAVLPPGFPGGQHGRGKFHPMKATRDKGCDSGA